LFLFFDHFPPFNFFLLRSFCSAREMKQLMAAYVRAQIEYYQKLVQTWGSVIPVLQEIKDK